MKADEEKRCGAKTRSGGKCRNFPSEGKARCDLHGGASPQGKASRSFKHGRYSKHLPTRLAARYDDLLADVGLRHLHDEIALITVRLQDVAETLSGDPNSHTWDSLKEHMIALRQIDELGNRVSLEGKVCLQRVRPDLFELPIEDVEQTLRIEREEALESVEQFILEGAKEGETWKELLQLIDQRRRLVLVETARRRADRDAVPIEEVMTLVAGFAALAQEIPDEQLRSKFSEFLSRSAGERRPVY